MRLDTITIENLLGVREARIQFDKPVQLIAGRNGAGKSSIADAVRLALTGDLGRVALKKHSGDLRHQGSKTALVRISLQHNGEDVSDAVISGGGGLTSNSVNYGPALPYCLDPHRFAEDDPDDRRTFLFDLMDVKLDADAVRQRLTARKLPPEFVERTIPMLRAGFPAAAKEAGQQATEARGAWKAIAGEAYGEKKAATWQAEGAEPVDPAELALIAGEVKAAETEIARLHTQIGEISGARKAYEQRKTELTGHRQTAGQYARIADKLTIDEADLARWTMTVQDLERTIATDSAPQCSCPECGAMLEIRGREIRLSAPRPEVNVAGMRTKLDEAIKARDLLASAVANDKRDLARADAAAEQLKAFDDPKAAWPTNFDEEADKARTALDEAKRRREAAAARKSELEGQHARALGAERKTNEARKAHQAVQAWTDIQDALSPDGIPGELLAAALKPFNQRLLESCDMTGWPGVQVGPDMQVTFGGRAYSLCSESERWRADTVIAEAIARFSHLQVLILDRADVLDLPARGELIGWLDELAETGELNSALVLATLKALPANLPPTFAAGWLHNGVLQGSTSSVREAKPALAEDAA